MNTLKSLSYRYTKYVYVFSATCLLVVLLFILTPSTLPDWENVVMGLIGMWGLVGVYYASRKQDVGKRDEALQNLGRKMDFLRIGEWLIIAIGVGIYVWGNENGLPLKWELFCTVSMLLLMTFPISWYTYLDRKRLEAIR